MPRLLRIVRELLRDPKNPSKRLEAMMKIGWMLVPGYRFHWPNPDWWRHAEFNDYLQRFDESQGLNSQRRWWMSQLLRMTVTIAGDTAECGVYRGAGSHMILRANARGRLPRHHHIFDSFAGISEPDERDGQYWSRGDLSAAENIADEALREFDGKTFYKGWIPQRFAEVADRSFSFVHVDVDLHEPTRDSIAFFYPRIAPGGIFLCDDYGTEFCPGATRACDEFLAEKPEKMLSMPDGGGFFVKGLETGDDLYR